MSYLGCGPAIEVPLLKTRVARERECKDSRANLRACLAQSNVVLNKSDMPSCSASECSGATVSAKYRPSEHCYCGCAGLNYTVGADAYVNATRCASFMRWVAAAFTTGSSCLRGEKRILTKRLNPGRTWRQVRCADGHPLESDPAARR
jgi:hypothetical protein